MQRSSTLAGDLVARLLDRNPDTRIAAAAALEHPWVKVCVCVRAHVCVCVCARVTTRSCGTCPPAISDD